MQLSHRVAGKGYVVSPYNTGYDRVIAHRTGDLFSTTADRKGVVVSVDPKKAIVVKYDDGEIVSVELGRRYGKVTGTVVPHTVVTNLKEGQKIDRGSVIAYNEGFFKTDVLDKNQVILKAGVIAKVALMEKTFTFEDACEIDEYLAGEISTDITDVKDITIDFSDHIRNMVSVGTEVDSETILCILENAVTGDSDLFDEETLQTLASMSSKAPKAGTKGLVEKIEVFYHGDKEDMSPSLRALADKSDRERAAKEKLMGLKPTTGFVGPEVRMGRDPLMVDQAMIKVYINHSMKAGIGDKGVFGNQMKTIISNIMTGVHQTEDGEKINAYFSYTSIANRMVESPKIMGTTITLLKVMSKKVFEYYMSKKGTK